MGLHSCRPVRVPLLTSVHRRKCQQLAHEHQNCTMVQWKKVAWSDESCFLLHHVNGWVCVHRLLGEHMAPGCTVGRRQASRGSVMLWPVLCSKNLWSCHPCGCYFDTYHLPKHCRIPCTPFHDVLDQQV